MPSTSIAARYAPVSMLLVAPFVMAHVAYAQPSAPAFERYVPFACSEIPGREQSRINRDGVLTWRDRWLDTTPALRTFGAEQVPHILAKVRACVGGYSVATTRPDQLIGLGATYLILNDTVHAAEAFERVIKLGAQQPIARRAFDLSQIVTAYLKANWLPQALSYMERLDALGPAAAGHRLAMHNTLFEFASGVDSVPLMAAQVNAARLAVSDMRVEARQEWFFPWQQSILYAVDLEGRRKDFAAIPRLKEQGSAAWDSVRPGAGGTFWGGTAPDLGINVGENALPLTSQLVYLPGETKPSAAPLVAPVRGKVSLLVSVRGDGLLSDEMQKYQLIAHLRQRFPANMLDITLVTQTSGISLDRLKMVPDPREEGESIRAFFHNYLRLSLPIAVRINTFTTDAKTGHRSQVQVKDPYRTGATWMLIDKFGVVRDVHGGGKRLENMIRELWAE